MSIPESIHSFLTHPELSSTESQKLEDYLLANKKAKDAAVSFFAGTDTSRVPLFILNKANDTAIVLFAKNGEVPPEPGEPGSVLAYVRMYGLGEDFLCSDCYGQLSCSSCAIEIYSGKAYNPVPKEEEFDMLDIDELKAPTAFTRLGCQTVVGTDALLIKIR
jgi:ferredoxin